MNNNNEETYDSLVPRPDEDWDDADMGDGGFVVFLSSEDFEAMEAAQESLPAELKSCWTGSGYGFGMRDHDYECPTMEEAKEIVSAYTETMTNAGSHFTFCITDGWGGEDLESGENG